MSKQYHFIVKSIEMDNQLDEIDDMIEPINTELFNKNLTTEVAETLLAGCDYETNNRLVIPPIKEVLDKYGFEASDGLFDACEGAYSLCVAHADYENGFVEIHIGEYE